MRLTCGEEPGFSAGVCRDIAQEFTPMAYTIEKNRVLPYPPEALRDFHIYSVEWIDNFHFHRWPVSFLSQPDLLPQYHRYACELWKAAGWDGDGDNVLFWLPGFVFPREMKVGHEGVAIWHVKQLNDGVSWLLSPVKLPWLA